MTAPAQQEREALDQLIRALAYAQSAKVVVDALGGVPDVSAAGIRLLMTIPQIRGLMRLHPEAGATAITHRMYEQNMVRRASYLAAASRRMTSAARMGPEAQARAVAVERRYLEQHLAADAGRMAAARAVGATARQIVKKARRDPVGSTWNGLLGWYAVMDDDTSAECRKAHGRNFDPTRIPPIGLPGTVHPRCRCRPGPPFPSSDGGAKGYERVESLRPERVRSGV